MISAVLSILMLLQAPSAVPRTADGHPDLTGIWQVRNTANWDLLDHTGGYKIPAGIGVVDGGVIPYRPEALAQKKKNFDNRLTADPVEKCYIAGFPRTIYLPYPFQIVQTPDAVIILSEWVHTWRWIPTAPYPRYDGYESWIGDPRGHWEGDTLVVESVGFNDQTWFDHVGDFHSDALKLTERFTRTAPDTITYEATIEDPKVFTKPWKIKMPIYQQKGMSRVLEAECYLNAEDAGKATRGTHPEDRGTSTAPPKEK
jgi:hypothetical protein